MTRKITIQDIAKQAGVSKATVSRVLNHKPDVDPATRERILRIVEEQGFVPSITAAGLAGGRNQLIGVLIPSLTWPLIPEIMRGVSEIIKETPYELVLYSSNNNNPEKDHCAIIDHILATRLVAGLLAIYPGQLTQHLQALHKQGVPVVILDDQDLPPEDISWVGADQYVGAYEATRYLIERGHRRIAHIQGPLQYQVSHDRYRGYCHALIEAGINLDSELVLEGDFMPTGGKECADRLFACPESRPTAIFAGSDLMAFGVFTAAEQHGLRVPDDVAVVGFDDITLAAHMQPPLTTVRQPLYEMGQQAIKLLLNFVNVSRSVFDGTASFTLRQAYSTNMLAVPSRIRLATDLVTRASC